MRIEITHHIDASEPNEQGQYEWYYEYDLHRFFEKSKALVARSYIDSKLSAHFLRFEVEGKVMAVTKKHLNDALLLQAVAHLRNLGKTDIEYLGPQGYEPLPTS